MQRRAATRVADRVAGWQVENAMDEDDYERCDELMAQVQELVALQQAEDTGATPLANLGGARRPRHRPSAPTVSHPISLVAPDPFQKLESALDGDEVEEELE